MVGIIGGEGASNTTIPLDNRANWQTGWPLNSDAVYAQQRDNPGGRVGAYMASMNNNIYVFGGYTTLPTASMCLLNDL